MGSVREGSPPRLRPLQACFVVDDVAAAVESCAERFGWGPFHRFTADVPDAQYGDWRGRKVTDVALGMAGPVQVELIHVRRGRDCVGAYQSAYGTGFQHLGIACRDRDAAVAQLEALGGRLHEQTAYGGFRIAFVDVPTGPAMFELLEQEGARKSGRDPAATPREREGRREEEADGAAAVAAAGPSSGVLALDRATIATPDLDRALRFYSAAFGWDDPVPETRTLRWRAGREARLRRFLGRAGAFEIELLEPAPGGDDPYARHLARGDHGLVHAGGAGGVGGPTEPALRAEWCETGEAFTLHDWAGGAGTLQLRIAGPADAEIC